MRLIPHRLLRGALVAAFAATAACPGTDDGTGAGGVLVVAQVQVDGGNRIVYVGGTRQLQASPRTSTGILVPGKAVAWSSSNTNVATVDNSGTVRGLTPGPVTITATVDGVAGTVVLDVRPVPVVTVQVTAGAETIDAGATTTVQAVARDSAGGVLTGRTIVWSSGNPTVATVSQDGVVTGVGGGTVTITATIDGQSGSVGLTVIARTATQLAFIGQPTAVVAGQPITPPIRVAFQDDGGATATTAQGTVTLSFSANPTGATLGGTVSVQAVQGIATFNDVRINRAGQPYSLQASTSGLPVATSSTFPVAAGPAAALSILTAPAGSAASGDPLAQQPVIQVRDAFGNAVAQAGVTVTASVATGPGTLGGTTAVVTDLDGRAVFTNLAILGSVGSYTLRFQAAGLTPAISGTIGVGAGDATQLTFTAAPPATAVNATPLPGAVVVQLRDGTGNPVAQSGTLVSVSLSGPAGVLAGPASAITAADGSATFNGLIITGTVGEYTLTFAAAGVSAAVSNPIALQAGPEWGLSFVTPPPATAVNGQAFTTAPVVQLRDVSGNPVAKAGVSIQAAIGSGPGAVLQGTLTRTSDAQGRATFEGLSLLGLAGGYTVVFSSGTLATAVSNPITLQPGPGVGLSFATAPPLGAASGVALSPQPVVQISDQSGNAVAVPGVTVTAALASGPGVLGGTLTATTGAGGGAAFTNLTLTGPAGAHTIRFTAPGYTQVVSGTITVGAGSPTQVTFTVAPPATATNAVAIAPAVVVQLRDGVGNPTPLGGVTITASRSSGTATLGGTLAVVTAADGRATFDDLVLTGVAGAHQLTFSASGLTPAVSNTITLQPGAATQLTFTTAPPATATNGVNIAPAIVVQLRDVSGNAVSSAGVNVTASLAAGAGGTLGGTTTVATGSGGSASFGSLRITGVVGSYTLRFSASGVSAATANPLTLQPGAATALAMATQPPPSATSGVALNPQPVVRVVDQSGNTVTGSTAAVTASLTSGPGTLGGTLTVNAVAGVASFTNLAITGTTGTYQIGFASAGLTGATSSTIGLGAGAAVGLQFVGTPATTATHGVAIAPAIAVRLVDGATNPVAQAGVAVSAVLASGAGSLGGTVAVNTDGTGTATFSNLVLTGTVGSYTIRFEVSGINPVTTAPITLAAGAAARLAFATAPSASAANGAALATQPVVQVQDASGNATNAAGLTITATLITNPGGALSNATATTNGAGQATFSGLTITGLAGLYTISYGSGALDPVSGNVSLTAGPPVAVHIFTQPGGTATNGQLLSPQPVARLVDQSGNNAGSNGTPITVAFGTTPGAATLEGTKTVNLGPPGARAVFTDLAILGTAGSYTLVFSSPGMTSATSQSVVVGAGAATQLLFTSAPPAQAVNGAVLAPAIGVRLGDATGNPVATAGVAIAAAIASGSGAALSGTTPLLTDGTGGVSFADLRLTGTVGAFTLTFTSSGLTPATTGTITLQPGPATTLAFTTAPPTSGTTGVVLSPATVVAIRDQSGNLVPADGTSITAEISAGAGGSLGGTLVRQSAAGSASFDDLVITGTSGNYTLRFTSAGLSSVSAPQPLALGAGSAAQLAFAVAPPASATSGSPLVPQPAIQVEDASGNPVSAAGVLVTATVSAGGSLVNATATTDGTGLATFSGLAITGAAGAYTLTFAAPDLPDLDSNPITLGAGAATQLAFVTAPPASATNGAILAPQPVVELRDGSNNPVATAGVTVTAALEDGDGSLLGTLQVQTDGAGRASFTNLELRGLPDSYVIRFTSGALPALDSDPITLAVGPASKLDFQQAPPASTTNGEPFPASTVVQLSDVAGNLVTTSGVNVLAAVATGPGTGLSGTTTRATVSGVATFDDLVLTGTAGTYTLSFSSGALTPATSNGVQLLAGTPTKLVFNTAPPATAQSGVAFSPAPVVQLQDANNNNASQSGVTVTVARVDGDGSVVIAGGSAVTDVNGRATFSTLSLTGPADDYVLAFLSSGLTGVTSASIALTAGGAAKLGFITTPSDTAVNGQALAQQPVVQLLDAANNPVAEAGREITIGLSGDGTLGADDLTVMTDGAGQAAFTGVTITGTVAGSRTLTFGGSGLSTLSSGNITLEAGPAAGLAMVVQPPASATSGATLAPATVVRLVDISGNAVASAGVDIAVTVDPAATLGGTTPVATAADGTATFSDLAITGPSGDYELVFTSGALPETRSDPVTVTAASGLSLATSPSAVVRNDLEFPQQPVVQLVDADDDPVSIAGIEVTATIASGGGQLLGTTTALTNSSGQAEFDDLRIQGTIGVRTLQFAATGLTPVVSGDVEVVAGVASGLEVATQPPATAVDGEPFGTAPVVQLVDVSGNEVDSTGVDVTVSLVGAGAALGGTLAQATGAGGTATFAGLSLDGAAGTYRLSFSGSGLPAVESTDIGLVVPAVIEIATEPPAAAVSGELLSPQPGIVVKDAADGPLVGVSVTASLLTDAGGPGDLLGTLTLVTGAGGTATWTDLRIQGSGTFRIQFATANGTTATTTVQIVIP